MVEKDDAPRDGTCLRIVMFLCFLQYSLKLVICTRMDGNTANSDPPVVNSAYFLKVPACHVSYQLDKHVVLEPSKRVKCSL